MSYCVIAIVADMRAVRAATTAITIMMSGASSTTGDIRANRYNPLVTMVAAWMSADTGVGPAMASGSHTNSGICALFPVAPMNMSKTTQFRVDWLRVSGSASSVPKSSAPTSRNSRNIASKKAKSPMRLTMKALLAAALFFSSVYQNPMSR